MNTLFDVGRIVQLLNVLTATYFLRPAMLNAEHVNTLFAARIHPMTTTYTRYVRRQGSNPSVCTCWGTHLIPDVLREELVLNLCRKSWDMCSCPLRWTLTYMLQILKAALATQECKKVINDIKYRATHSQSKIAEGEVTGWCETVALLSTLLFHPIYWVRTDIPSPMVCAPFRGTPAEGIVHAVHVQKGKLHFPFGAERSAYHIVRSQTMITTSYVVIVSWELCVWQKGG